MHSLVLFAALRTWLTPIWMVLVGGAAALLVIGAVYGLLRLFAPKVAAIAYTTAKEGWSQPLFGVLLAIGAALILLVPFVPYNTFGEDVKVVKDTGLTLIMVLGIILALWTASVSIADEIEGRTALTLLSKPIGRRQFIFGKFFGVLTPVALLFVFLGMLFLATVSFKVVYDARETGNAEPTTEQCREEMLQIVPGLALAFMEAAVLTAISVAISTRLPMLPNLVICATIYALGHLLPLIVSAGSDRFYIVSFMGRLIATVLPVLDHFNIQAAVATGQTVPLAYLGMAFLYCVLYCVAALLLALLLFEDRDLA